jgi:hypothetical protein
LHHQRFTEKSNVMTAAARGSGLKLLSVLPGKWSMSSPMSLDDSYYEGEVLGRMEVSLFARL